MEYLMQINSSLVDDVSDISNINFKVLRFKMAYVWYKFSITLHIEKASRSLKANNENCTG